MKTKTQKKTEKIKNKNREQVVSRYGTGCRSSSSSTVVHVVVIAV